MSTTLFKKAMASVAAFSLVVSVLAPVSGVNAYDNDIEAANFLASKGVIIDQASNPSAYNLRSNITRREAVKIAVLLATDGVEPAEATTSRFRDMSTSDWGTKYTEEAAKRGIISSDNATFRPDANLTEAEALKMAMVAAGIAPVAGTDPWYAGYRTAAIDNGILSPSTTVSGNVNATRSFLILAAANAVEDKGSNPDVGGELPEFNFEEWLKKMMEDEELKKIEEGKENPTDPVKNPNTPNPVVVTGNDVEVTLDPSGVVPGSQVPKSGNIRLAKVAFTAGESDVAVRKVDITSVGLSSLPSSFRLWFEEDGRRISSRGSLDPNRQMTLSFNQDLVVPAKQTRVVDLYALLDGTISSGDELQMSGQISDSSATNNNGSFLTQTLKVVNYTVVTANWKKLGAPSNVNQSEDYEELGRFSIENYKTGIIENRDVNFQSVTLRNEGNGDLFDLEDLHLERNGQRASDRVIAQSKDATFIVNDTIQDGGTVIYSIKAKIKEVQNTSGDEYQFNLRNTTDLSVVEILNGFRATVKVPTVNDNILHKYTVKGSDLTFSRDNSVSLSQTYSQGSSDVVLLQGFVSARGQVTMEDPKIPYTWNGVVNTGADKYFNSIQLNIGSYKMTWVPTSGTGVADFSGTAMINGKVPFTITGKVKSGIVTADLNKIFKFADVSHSIFTRVEYANGNLLTASVGVIPGINVSIDNTGLSISRVDGIGGNTTFSPGSNDVVMNTLRFSVNQGNDVQISNAKYKFTGSGSLGSLTTTATTAATTANTTPNAANAAANLTAVNALVAAIPSSQLSTLTTAATTAANVFNTTPNAANAAANLTAVNALVAAATAANSEVYNGYQGNATATLLIDGVEVATRSVTSDTVTFDNFSRTVSKSPITLTLKVNFSDGYKPTTGGTFRLSAHLDDLSITDVSSSSVVTLPTQTSPSLELIDAKAAILVSDQNPKSSLFAGGELDQRVFAFRVRADNDSVTLRDLKLTGTNLNAMTNYRLIAASNTSRQQVATTSTNTALEFLNINEGNTVVVPRDRTETFYVIADTNYNTNQSGVKLSLTTGDTYKFRSGNGTETSGNVSSNLEGNNHYVAENKIQIVQVERNEKSLDNHALAFTITATGKNTVYLKKVGGIIQTNSEYASTGEISLYRRNSSASNLAGTTTTLPNNTTNNAWSIDITSYTIPVACLDSSSVPVAISDPIASQITCVNHPTLASGEYYTNGQYTFMSVGSPNRSIESGAGSEKFILTYNGSMTGSNSDANWRIEVNSIEVYLGADGDAASVIAVENYESVGLLPFVVSK